MGYAVGLAPDSQGNGTTPADLRRWIWSLYRVDTAQIARGLAVTGRSDMQYAVAAGVVIVPTGAQEAVAVPVSSVTVSTPAAPSSGTRTDYIYVGQDGVVYVGTSQPANTALLDKRTVPANITATTATTSTLGDRKYAPLFGSSMGMVSHWREGTADLTKVTDARKKVASQTFTLDSDRRCEFTLQISYEMSRAANVEPDGWKTATFLWEIWDGSTRLRSMEIGVPEFAETKCNISSYELGAGTHTISLYRTRRLMGTNNPSTDYPVHRNGGAENWPGTTLSITDMGGVD